MHGSRGEERSEKKLLIYADIKMMKSEEHKNQ
jgi:hypothetical protein